MIRIFTSIASSFLKESQAIGQKNAQGKRKKYHKITV